MVNTKNIKSMAILTFVTFYLINVFFANNLLDTLMSLIIVGILAIFLPLLKGFSGYICWSLFGIGTFLMIKFNASLMDWQTGLIQNAGIITLLVTVPILGFPLSYYDFQQAIQKISQKYLSTPLSFYKITTLLTFSLGVILNIASISIVYHLLRDTKKQYPDYLFSSALTRGIMASGIWSPSFVGVAIVLHYTGLSWAAIAPLGFLLAMVALILSIKFEQSHYKNHPTIEAPCQKEPKISGENQTLLKRLIKVGLSLLFAIILLESLTGLSVLVVVPLVSIVGPFVIALIWGKLPVFFDSLKNFANNKLPEMKNEICLFTAAGFFGHSLDIAHIGNSISDIINSLNIQQSYLFIIILLAIIVLLSLIGIHPLISSSTLLITLPVAKLPLMPIQYALTILIGYSMATILSPISGTVLITSGVLKKNPFKIGLLGNGLYTFLLVMVDIIILSLIPF
ncbi:MAG: hypothetical protein GXW85_07675 [Clostridia bacterium]|nr:hypothetical protein [Clostridia bacterium]